MSQTTPPRCHRRHPHGVTGDTPVQFSFSSCSLVLILRCFIPGRFRACGWFCCDVGAARSTCGQAHVDAFKLNRIGAFAEGAVTRLKWGDLGGCLLARQAPNILINGNPVLVVWDEQGRPWFECSACGRRVILTL